MSDSESSSGSEVAVQQPKKTTTKAGKKKAIAESSSKPAASAHGKNEGTDPNHAYQSPPGAVPVDLSVDAGEFDWDAVNEDEDVELWLIRVPQGLKAKHLQGIKFESPSASKTSRIGGIDRKHASYDIWSLGDSVSDHVGGEELKRLSCLLPRKDKGGKLYQAPQPIARHIVVTAKPEAPTPVADANDAEDTLYKNPPRPRYPLEVLKHRFMPLGSLASTGAPDAMDVDLDVVPVSVSQTKDGPPKKKRKGDGVSKKSKKSKATAS
ncbi:uncharacterized protein B0H18DRAFT_1045048 [Fomitopsis serialis]|uniref:uncharacterized protein n=1 Tax=Fomitopsis serialis TaxID=139415 RepID=UPI002008D862|nr:uncharacterized protein B0H18DRAFT_1045048 [Neoantrodia serialis]KAH9914455.1 hypothetical protein B0H18DRAFT_1045048 [Neoantrodia serialis]